MQRWITLILGLGVVVLVVAITVRSAPPSPFKAMIDGDASADASSGSSGADASAPSADAASAALKVDSLFPDDGDSGLNIIADLPVDAPREGGIPLPPGSPRRVRFGIVLIQYEGAEGADPKARSKNEARAIADKVAAEAKTDFHGAVQHGDSGSADDIGFVQRGVLEPGPEYALFTLAIGGVSDVLDTPRGFWIAKRLE